MDDLKRAFARICTPCSFAREASRFSLVMSAHPSCIAVWAIRASRECLMFPDLSARMCHRRPPSSDRSRVVRSLGHAARRDRTTEEREQIEQPIPKCGWVIQRQANSSTRHLCRLPRGLRFLGAPFRRCRPGLVSSLARRSHSDASRPRP